MQRLGQRLLAVDELHSRLAPSRQNRRWAQPLGFHDLVDDCSQIPAVGAEQVPHCASDAQDDDGRERLVPYDGPHRSQNDYGTLRSALASSAFSSMHPPAPAGSASCQLSSESPVRRRSVAPWRVNARSGVSM